MAKKNYRSEFIGSGKVATRKDGTEIRTKDGKKLLQVMIPWSGENLENIKRAVNNGWLTITIGSRETPSEKGMTHWASVSYEEKGAGEHQPKPEPEPAATEPDDDFPF